MKSPINHHNQEAGFTIVELMIASVVFSVVLLLCTVGIIQISRTYYKGITTTKTEQTARSVLDRISQSIQFSGGTVTQTPSPDATRDQYFCINNELYSYHLGQELIDGPNYNHALVVTNAACSGAQSLGTRSTPTGQELLSPNMRLAKLSVKSLGNNNLYRVTVRVVYGDDDLLLDQLAANGSAGNDGVLDTCKGATAGAQFCAVSELSTVVQKRTN